MPQRSMGVRDCGWGVDTTCDVRENVDWPVLVEDAFADLDLECVSIKDVILKKKTQTVHFAF